MIEKLSIVIITKNAAETLERTLKSVVGLAREILVIDDYSSDTTLEIAQAYGSRIVRHRCYDLGEQRAFALAQVGLEWVLVLDSDEVLTEQNKNEINNAIFENKYDGYYLHFRNHFFGKKLMHGELHEKLVLFKTQKAFSSQKLVHEKYEVKGKIGELQGEVLHFSYRSVQQIVKKFFDYSIRQAKEYKKEEKRYGVRELLLDPFHMFYSRFIVDKGYKDGPSRIILDSAFAAMEFLSYALIPFVKEKKRIAVDCGSYDIAGTVRSGIDRVIQGIYSQKNNDLNYYWFGFHKKSPNKLTTRWYSKLWLPLITLFNRCDVFLGTGSTIPWLLHYFPIKKVLFLYDFGFFSSPDKYDSSAKRLQQQTVSSLQWADTVVVLHEEIYKELQKRYPHYSHKTVVVPSGVDHLERVEEKSVFIQEKKPLILFVGVVKPVKRIDKILSAIGDSYCIIAGPQEKEYVKTLKIRETQNVQFIQNFSDGQLKWLYKNADVMLYTSEHEGFCYPILEALSLGLPVIALDLPLFRTYQQFFPHLTLVKTEKEMKEALKKISNKKSIISNSHPYTWKNFNEKLNALWQPLRATRQTTQKIGFIVVLYKTPQEEKKRLEREIKKMGLSSYVIYWVDNLNNNKGYAAGVNEGIRRGMDDSCDYFIALNPDISLQATIGESFLFVAQLFDVWGYTMLQGKEVFYGGEIDRWRLSGGLIKKRPVQRFVPVDFVSGSLIGFSKEVVQKIGLWSEDYFMYYEDVDYCVRARKAGFQVGIDSTEIYEHYELSQANDKKKEWIARSRWKFFWKYANALQKIRELIRLPKTLVEIRKNNL